MHLDLDRYFKTKAEKFLHQAPTPTRFLLSGCLRWLAGGSGHDIIFFCGVRYRTWQKQRWIVLDALLELYFKSKIQLPTTDEARKVLSEIFKEKNGIDGQLGAIDGLLIHIHLPPGTKNARKFQCYKSYYALNMQAVAGPNGEYLYVNIGHAGATGDGCAIRQSKFWKLNEDNVFKHTEGFFWIADNAYGLMPWLMCPFADTTLGTQQDIFNLQLSKARQVIERAFGMTIQRFRILAAPLRFTVDQCVKIAKVCCALHNLCLQDNASNTVTVLKADDARRPFIAKERLVPKILYHVDGYREPDIAFTIEERQEHFEKHLKTAAALKRVQIMTALRDRGYKRQQKRGQKRGASYQQHGAYAKRSCTGENSSL